MSRTGSAINEADPSSARGPSEMENGTVSANAEPEAKVPQTGHSSGDLLKQMSMQSNEAQKQKSEPDGFDRIPSPGPEISQNPAADARNVRRLIAEDNEWNLMLVPRLVDITIQNIIKNFPNNPLYEELKPRFRERVIQGLSTEVPIKVSAPRVTDMDYWKRMSQEKWRVCDVSKYGDDWKQLYFERSLRDIIELLVPQSTPLDHLNEIVILGAPFIKRLDVRQLLPPVKEELPARNVLVIDEEDDSEPPNTDHFDFQQVVPRLPHLEELHVTYSVKDCGMNFEWGFFNFTPRDCNMLAKIVADCKHLRVLHIYQSKIDDDKCRVLISHLLDHPGLRCLDLSHNLIGDKGARGVGKLLSGRSQLTELTLCNNKIRNAGAQAIAHALTKTTTLQKLDLRLNRIADEGGQAIAKGLLRNESVVHVNIASNLVTEASCSSFSQVLMQNNVLRELDLSNNKLSLDGGKHLQEKLEENHTITILDLRHTECEDETLYYVNRIIQRNRDEDRIRKEKAQEQEQAKK